MRWCGSTKCRRRGPPASRRAAATRCCNSRCRRDRTPRTDVLPVRLMRFATLGSGSKGNATLVDAGGTRVLVDCGFSLREAQARSERLAFDLDSLDGVL